MIGIRYLNWDLSYSLLYNLNRHFFHNFSDDLNRNLSYYFFNHFNWYFLYFLLDNSNFSYNLFNNLYAYLSHYLLRNYNLFCDFLYHLHRHFLDSLTLTTLLLYLMVICSFLMFLRIIGPSIAQVL